jgi:two-component system sensor histidine kinase PilS (NtrC family)
MNSGASLQPGASSATYWRTLLTFSSTRIVIAVFLMFYLAFGFRESAVLARQLQVWQTCGAYLLLAVAFVVIAARYQHRFFLQLVIQISVDLVVMSILYAAAGGATSGLAILFLFPLAGAAILAPLTLALFFASIATLFLLLDSGYRILSFSSDVVLAQTGLFGAAFLASVFVINRLAAKLIRQEALATRRGIDLQVQEAINRLVIADMGDGILVVGAGGEIYTGNPAAGQMLGLTLPYAGILRRLTDINTLMPIADAFFAWRLRQPELEALHGHTKFVTIKPADEQPGLGVQRIVRREVVTHLKLHFAKVETVGLSDDRTVIFLQDVSEIENQAQQLKLASMGRLTASIAHEVRNPLSAIAHASTLLAEDALTGPQSRLLKIIGDNVARLDRIIEDILKLSRKAQLEHEPLALARFFKETVEEFREMHGISEGVITMMSLQPYRIRFDVLHLREVIVNLLANALRYASKTPGSIRIFAVAGSLNRIELHVQDDGPPLTPEVRAHLFEPFYTNSSQGTGLGLYMARELCRNNGAMIDYEYRVESADGQHGKVAGRFVITLAAAGKD